MSHDLMYELILLNMNIYKPYITLIDYIKIHLTIASFDRMFA